MATDNQSSTDTAAAQTLADEMANWKYPKHPKGADDCLHQCAFSEFERDLLVRVIRGAAQPPTDPAIECWSIAEQLRAPEGAEVILLSDNPDFNGQPNNAIEIVDDWTRWNVQRFTGDTMLDALRAALKARDTKTEGVQYRSNPNLKPGLEKAAEIVGNMRQSEAGIFDASHSGQRGEDRSTALYDACQAIRKAIV